MAAKTKKERKVKVEGIKREEKQLSKGEQQKVKGGMNVSGIGRTGTISPTAVSRSGEPK
ncbi:MAG TPA: hypothetical protein VF546_24215 [Pyrinomonadaceae bacterium]|jgi:hypothetical protein